MELKPLLAQVAVEICEWCKNCVRIKKVRMDSCSAHLKQRNFCNTIIPNAKSWSQPFISFHDFKYTVKVCSTTSFSLKKFFDLLMPLTYLETIRENVHKMSMFQQQNSIFLFEFEHNPRPRDKSELHFKWRASLEASGAQKKFDKQWLAKFSDNIFLPTSFVCLPTPKIFSRPERGPRWKSPAPGFWPRRPPARRRRRFKALAKLGLGLSRFLSTKPSATK